MPATSQVSLIRAACRASFSEFVRELWEEVVQEKLVWNWHMDVLCDELQALAERVFRGQAKDYDLCINISPGTTKSTICSVMFPAWVWTRMPHARIICGSHTETLVLDLSRRCRDVVRSQKYRDCFPEVVLRDDQDTKGQWLNTKGGERFSCTVGGKSPMGIHAHFIIIDDPIDPQKAISDAELKNANDWMDSTLPTRKVDKTVTPTILVMQRLAQGDPAGNMIETPDVRHVCLPAELVPDEDGDAGVRPKSLERHYVDGLMDPQRMPKSVLAEFRSKGEYYYAGQFLQNPVPRGGGMFKIKRLKYGTAPAYKEFRKLVRFWDKSATHGDGAFTVGTLMGEDRQGFIWILDVIREQMDSGERELLIDGTANRDGRRVMVGVEQEPGSGGKESAEKTVLRLSRKGFRCRVVHPTGSEQSKKLRADPLSTQVNNGNVYLQLGEWNKTFVDEMKYFPFSRYKDQVDSASGAFTCITSGYTLVGSR